MNEQRSNGFDNLLWTSALEAFSSLSQHGKRGSAVLFTALDGGQLPFGQRTDLCFIGCSQGPGL